MIYRIESRLFFNGTMMVVSTSCAAIINTSGLKSKAPAGGMYFLNIRSTGFVRLYRIGAAGVCGLIQLNTACISTAYKKIEILRLRMSINARPSMTTQTMLPATNTGKPLSSKVKKWSTTCVK